MLSRLLKSPQRVASIFRRNAHIYTYIATSRESSFSAALKECIDDIKGNFSETPTMAMFFSSHKEVEESQYSSFYEQNQWLKSGCMVPSISEDSSVRMCISGLLVEGGDSGVLISKNFSSESLEHIENESLPCLTLKPFTSPVAFDVGKMKAPSGLLVSRNTSALHDPLVIDSCYLEGKKEENGICIRFKKEVFKERMLIDVMGQILSLVHPYLCSFNLPFWNILFPSPFVPQVLSTVPSAKQSSLPLLRGLALVFPMSTATLYVYQPNHLYMLHKHLHESFIVTPPNKSQSNLGTICHVEEVVSVGADGAVLCKVRGDQKVHITQLHPVMSEMGSVLGDSSIAEDVEGDSVCDESSGSWKAMLRVREKILTLYHNHSMCDEVIKRYGSMPYHPRLFSYWLSGVLIAEGSEKEKWFSISSTQQRLEAIERTLDKIKL